MLARVRQGPPAPGTHWTLRTIRAAVPAVATYSLSGLWRLLTRAGLRWRTVRDQQFSPDPDYAAKRAQVLACLRAAAPDPAHIVVLFLDEMGFTRWPGLGRDWVTAPARVDRQQAPNGLWRVIAALHAHTGHVIYQDNYIVGRKQLGQFYRRIAAAYPDAATVYVVQDNWSIHHHPDVAAVLATLPRLQPVWLPTYAPWLNPIENLWRWLRQEVLRLHRLAATWPELRARVRAFLDQFAAGSPPLLRYVGLTGSGDLAVAARPD